MKVIILYAAFFHVCGQFFPPVGRLVISTPFKGTVQRDFLILIFLGIGSSQGPYLVSEGFSNLTSISRRYSQFLLTSCNHEESTLPVLFNWGVQIYELCAETLGCHLIQKVETPCNV